MTELSTTARKALHELRRALSTPSDSPDYSDAVATVAYQLGRAEWMPPAVERFITPWLTSHRSEEDAETLYTFGRIYQRAGALDSAAMVYHRLYEVAGSHRDVLRRLAALGSDPLRSAEVTPSANDVATASAPRPMPTMTSKIRGGATGPRITAPPRGLKEVTAARSAEERRERLSADLSERSRELGLPQLDVGSVVADRYEIVAPLGEGGYAVVFEVWDRMLEEQVAMKLFRPAPKGEDDLARFKQELRLTRRLAHPNIVATYDFKAWQGMHFITMELLQGADLLTVLEEMGGRLPVQQALLLAGQAYAGMGAAHRAGVVHRDIKPANLFVLEGGTRLKVMDFGIAKTRGAAAGFTRPGWLVGTPAYLAPERLEAGDAGHAPSVDIYAMGVVLYRMVCGMLPFHEIDFEKLGRMIRKDMPDPPSRYAPELPDALDRLILDLLAKRPEDRPASCFEVQGRIRALMRAMSATGAEPDGSLF